MNLIKKLLIAGSFAILLYSCQKDKISPDEYMMYNVDGVMKTVKPEVDDFAELTGLLIDGTKGNDGLQLFIDTNVSVGSFPMSDNIYTVSAIYTDRSGTYSSRDGMLNIKSYDGNHISGTFRFTASTADHRVTKNFTEGAFSSKIEYITFSSDTTDYDDPTLELARRKTLMQQHLSQKQLQILMIRI